MQLHHQISGQGPTLLILHGLFGSIANWGSQARTLSEHYQVISVDMRNHGRSPHSDVMDYPSMAVDIVELMDNLSIDKAAVLGHSMGGKAAMQLAMNHSERVERLIVVDIAPAAYEHLHLDVFNGLNSVELGSLSQRSQADAVLAKTVTTDAVRSFLLKNLYRDSQGNFAWRANIAALEQQYSNIAAAPTGTPYSGPSLFIKGMDSHYITSEHQSAIGKLFPAAQYKLIEGAGHWPHAEKPSIVTRLIRRFMDGSS